MSGFQTMARPRPVLNYGPPMMPVVPFVRVGRAPLRRVRPPRRPFSRKEKPSGWPNLKGPVPRPIQYSEPPAELSSTQKAKWIIRQVADRHYLTVDVLRGPSRDGIVSQARREAVVRIRQEIARPGLRIRIGFVQIGDLLGLDHTTAVHAWQRRDKRVMGSVSPEHLHGALAAYASGVCPTQVHRTFGLDRPALRLAIPRFNAWQEAA